MARKKNKSKTHEEKTSTKNQPSIGNIQMDTVSDCKFKGPDVIMRQDNESKFQFGSMCTNSNDNMPEESIQTNEKSLNQQEQQTNDHGEEKANTSDLQHTTRLPNKKGSGITEIAWSWYECILEIYKGSDLSKQSLGICSKEKKTGPKSTEKTDTPPVLHESSESFSDSICYEAATWLHHSWSRTCQENKYNMSSFCDPPHIMVYVDIMLQAWTKHIQVSMCQVMFRSIGYVFRDDFTAYNLFL